MTGKAGKSGGARPGAGRKPSKPPEIVISAPHSCAMAFLVEVMNDPASDARMRVDAAKALLPFQHQKLGEGGKKDVQADKAKKVASKFSTTAAPLKLVVGK